MATGKCSECDCAKKYDDKKNGEDHVVVPAFSAEHGKSSLM